MLKGWERKARLLCRKISCIRSSYENVSGDTKELVGISWMLVNRAAVAHG